MRNKIGLFFLVVLFSACDYMSEPLQKIDTCPSIPMPALTKHKRKVLIEDYTGHTCGNCPFAGAEAEKLRNKYPDQVVTVAVHAGYFAETKSKIYTYDFRTTAGNEYDVFFGISAKGNPNGMINRVDFPQNLHIKDYTTWEALVDAQVALAPEADISIINEFDISKSKLCSHIQSVFLNSTQDTTYNLVVLLTEDSIVKPQKFYTPPVDSLTYVHHHVLRAAMNGEKGKGETIFSGKISADSTVIKNSSIKIDPIKWDYKKCSVVAFLYNTQTQRILQVEEKKVVE